MVSPEDVLYLYNRLLFHGIQVWLVGGWGIDALLGEHTRPHKDLDVIMLVDDVVLMQNLMAEDGYVLHGLWSENQWALDVHGTKVATAFVLQDPAGRQVDAHAMRLDSMGNGLPAWEKEQGFMFTPLDLSGVGKVAGVNVQCKSAESQMASHIGYKLPGYQWDDLQRLHEKFDIEYPPEITNQRSGGQ